MLNDEQIKTLFTFCEKHYVHHYDVKVELVDHLANAIEEKMKDEKQLSFETALNKVYAGFGFKGFAGIVQSKEAMVRKKWQRMRWRNFLAFFTWPKAGFTLFLLAIIFLTGRNCGQSIQKWFLIICLISFLVLDGYETISTFRNRKKMLQKLLATNYFIYFPAFSLLFIDIQFSIYQYNFFEWSGNSGSFTVDKFYISAVTMLLLFMGSIGYRSASQELMNEAKKNYPDAFAG